MPKAYCNGRIFDGEKYIDDKAVIIDEGKIVSIVDQNTLSKDLSCYDLADGLLVPGFVDVQVNGGGGIMFNDIKTLETLETMVHAHRHYGTTTLFPTLISDTFEKMEQVAQLIGKALQSSLPGIRGVHYEGPYLNIARKGVHRPDIIRGFDSEAEKLLTSQDLGVVIVTLAPENVAADKIKRLTEAGVRVCAGHSAATYEDMQVAFQAGLSGATHLFNAMSAFESRKPGVVGSALENPDCWCGLIVDGYHVHPASMRVVLAAKKTGKMMLVTDAMASVGAVHKRFMLNDEEIQAVDGRCATAEGVLAGSDLDMIGAVKNSIKMMHLPLSEALRMASLYPAQFVGLADNIGRIKVGYDADFVHLDSQLNVVKTWIGGA